LIQSPEKIKDDWGSMSRLDLVYSIAYNSTFSIDDYKDNTGDRSYFQGHYYSDKPPGLSFLAIPSYILSDSVYNFLTPDYRHIFYPEERFFFTTKTVVMFTNCLFFALSVVLLYDILSRYTRDEKTKMLVVLAYGLGTMALPYSTTLVGSYSVSSFLLLLLFLMFLKRNRMKKHDFLVMGLVNGIGLMLDYSLMLIFAILVLFLFSDRKIRRMALFYLLGFAIGVFPLLVYNHVIFGSPFTLSYEFLDETVWKTESTEHMIFHPLFSFPRFETVFMLLFSLYRGLFVYNPVLLLSFIGLFYFAKKQRKEAVFILSFFLFLLLLNSAKFYGWDGGSVFGPQYMTLSIPLLAIPLVFSIKKMNKKIVCFFIVISAVVNFIGVLYFYEGSTDPNPIYYKIEYGLLKSPKYPSACFALKNVTFETKEGVISEDISRKNHMYTLWGFHPIPDSNGDIMRPTNTNVTIILPDMKPDEKWVIFEAYARSYDVTRNISLYRNDVFADSYSIGNSWTKISSNLTIIPYYKQRN
jgi:hypothetical protein